MQTVIEFRAENRRLKNLIAAAGSYFIKRQRDGKDDETFEKAFLDTALPIMLALEKEEAAERSAMSERTVQVE